MSDGKDTFNPKKTNGRAETEINFSSQGGTLPSTPPALPILENMYRGYFPLWRKIRDWGWYKDSFTKSVFLELLLIANFKSKDYLGHIIKCGQCVVGRKSLSASLGMSERQIRTTLKRLISTNEITIKTTNKFSIITLNNFSKYTKNDQQNDPPKTNKRPTKDQQTTTPYNDKNDNNDNNIYIEPPLISDLETAPQKFVKGFSLTYQSLSGQPFKAEAKHFIIATKLIKDYGTQVVIDKTKIFVKLCADKSVWFTKDGWADFTIENLSAMWNNILPKLSKKEEDDIAFEKIRKEDKEHNERVKNIIKSGRS